MTNEEVTTQFNRFNHSLSFQFFAELNEHIVLNICTCTVLTAGDVFILQRICG